MPPDDATQDETPRQFLQRRFKKLDAEAMGILTATANHRICFYAGGELDLQPLFRLTHLCDTFICHCDFAAPLTLTQAVRKSLSQYAFFGKIDKATMRRLGLGKPRGFEQGPWGRFARLHRMVGGQKRTINFIGLGCSATAAYKALFVNQGTAPVVLCLPFRSYFRRHCDPALWEGVLGQAIAGCVGPVPRLVVSSDDNEGWPWIKPWQELPGWRDMRMRALGDEPAPAVTLSRTLGHRHITITRRDLTPANCGDLGGVLISPTLLTAYSWPRALKVLVHAPKGWEPDARARRLNPRITTVRLKQVSGVTLPLKRQLLILDKACETLGITHLATGRLGVEDEGVVLGQWRMQPGPIKRLTLHCPLDGDVESFGPYVDVID